MEASLIVEIIAKILIPLIGAILTIIVWPLIQAKTTTEQRRKMEDIARTAVWAAEQLQEAGVLSVPKKEYVIDYLNTKGWKITTEDLDMMVEALVRELNIKQGEQKKALPISE